MDAECGRGVMEKTIEIQLAEQKQRIICAMREGINAPVDVIEHFVQLVEETQ